MTTNTETNDYKSIFSHGSRIERRENFEDYWKFSLKRNGQIFESKKELEAKREKLAEFQNNPVRSKNPLPDPDLFYRNYVHMKDDPKIFDKKTLLLTCIYKFARHEWVGISAAWDVIPAMERCKTTTDKISRYHLCEEFSHVRFFHEMFRTFHLEEVKWVPLGKFMQKVYKLFPYFPEWMMSPPAFVTELMGMTFYIHTDKLLDTIFADEPEARDRIRALLTEIMVDELAHIGQRRNYMGYLGIKLSRWMVRPLYKMFFNDIPEAKYLYDIDQLIKDGLAFDYSTVSSQLIERSWVPSYLARKKADLSSSAAA